MRAHAEARAALSLLSAVGVPQDAIDSAYQREARRVAEETRETLKQSGVPELIADGIIDRLIQGLPGN